MSIIVGAIVGTSVIGAGVSMYAAGQQADATQAAGDMSLAATRESNALTKEMYEQGREDMEPWRVAGENAIQRIEAQPDFKFDASEFQFMSDPGYSFRLEEGINALDASAASRGRLQSGAQQKAIVGYGQDMASQEYKNAYNRWQSEEQNRFEREKAVFNTNENRDRYLAGQGQAAAAGTASSGNQMADTSARTAMAGATAAGNAAIAGGNAMAAGAQGVATSFNTGVENYLLTV